MTSETPAAAEEFVRRLHSEHGGALLGWARTRVADERDAEEIIAETLVKAWRNHDRFDPSLGSERTWLFAIARNAAHDHHRRTRRHLALVDTADVPDDAETDRDIEGLAEASVIRDALMDLPEHHRAVIVEAFFAGRTSNQIADRLDIPSGTVKSRLYYGMRRLRAALEERGVLQ